MNEFIRPKRILQLILFSTVCLISCNYAKGTLGASPGISYAMPVQKLRSKIDSLFYNNPKYNLPEKWADLDDWSSRGLGFLNGKIFYFNSDPEEMYYVTIDSTSSNNTLNATMFIRSINSGGRWSNYADITDKEKKRVEARFDQEIVPKLDSYTQIQSVKDSVK